MMPFGSVNTVRKMRNEMKLRVLLVIVALLAGSGVSIGQPASKSVTKIEDVLAILSPSEKIDWEQFATLPIEQLSDADQQRVFRLLEQKKLSPADKEALSSVSGRYQDISPTARIDWDDEDRFGLFLHAERQTATMADDYLATKQRFGSLRWDDMSRILFAIERMRRDPTNVSAVDVELIRRVGPKQWGDLISNYDNAMAASFRNEFRTWTSKDGLFTVEAAYLGVEKNVVSIKKKDGTIVEVPLAKLSKEDFAFVRKQSAAEKRNAAKSQTVTNK
jgi:hypothetical protein